MSYRHCRFFVFVIFTSVGIGLIALRGTEAITLTNSAPSAVNDSYTLHGNGNAGSVLVNDSDPDPGDTLTATTVTNPANGSISNNGGGNFYYSRNNSTWTGTDSFTYKACDNHSPSLCSNATVNVNVVNQTPSATNDIYNVHGATTIGPFKSNDSDPDGDPLTYTQLTSPSHGTLSVITQSDMPRYTPASGFVGTDSFTYKVCDQFSACSSTATVFVNVNDISPVANADYFIVHGSAIIGPMKGNDYDPDGDSIGDLSLIVGAAHGTVYGLANPPYPSDFKQYVPNAGFTGTDTWQYRICDNLGACSTATVYILVLAGAGPTTKVPYACGCPMDPSALTMFNPEQGALLEKKLNARASGPISADPVNLATGRESFLSLPDLSVYNPSGPPVIWQRAFLSDRALSEVSGYASPGFTRGWVHNYDLSIKGTSGSWGVLTLNYPNGATETLSPQLSGGSPTGAFSIPAGAPYTVTGVPGSPTGTWQSISIKWKDQTEWKFTLLSGTTYALNKITSRMGKSLRFSWNGSRALTQVIDDATSTSLLTLSYLSSGLISTATDVYSRQVAYTFTVGTSTTPTLLTSVSQLVTSGTPNPPLHFIYTYTSDKGQQLNTVTVPSPTGTGTSTATINYDAAGKVTSVVDANGNQRIYTYNSGTTLVQVKDASNSTALSWTQKFNTNNLDTGTTDAASHSTTIAYSDSSNPLKPTSFTDRNGHVSSYTYDSHGNVLTVTSPRGVTTTFTWSYTNFALGRLISIQEGTKPVTTLTYYEPSGLVQSITRPELNNGAGTTTTSYTYDDFGNVLTVVSPGNNATSSITTTLNYTSDGSYSQAAKIGQPLTVTDNVNHPMHLRYDSQGRVTSATDAIGNETDFSYNLIGQLITTTYPATGQTGSGNSHTTNAYLYVGGPLTSTTFYDESNTQVRQVTLSYGLEGESLSVSGSTELVTNTYDALYRLKTLKDGNNNSTSYAYNSIGFLSSITMPGSEVTQFTSYDNAGNLLQRIDGNGVTTNYVYNDSESLLTDIQYPATTSLNVHFSYDSYGRRSGMTDSTGGQSYSYGNLDEVMSVATTYTGLPTKTVSYNYYPDGSRQSMTTPAGIFEYGYDAAGRPASMENPFSETTSWSYQDNNWLHTQTLENGATATYSYNALGQITHLLNQIGGTTISDFSSITYDGVGNRASVTVSIPGTTSLNGTTSYIYDSKNQLSQESSTRNGGFTDNFSYDLAGNPTSFKGVTNSYNSNNQQSGAGFVYDGNGNPTTYRGTTITFDSENRMTAFNNTLSAAYNGDGLRSRKTSSSSSTFYIYDGVVPIVELNSSGAVTATNSYGPNGLVSRSESGTKFYAFDSEGNAIQRSDSAGSVLSSSFFDSHGNLLAGNSTAPFGYKAQVGYYGDPETDLQLLTHRYYDPSTGRLLTRDPLGYGGGMNLYGYVTNNPVNLFDPLGLDGWGNDLADWLDQKIEGLRTALESNPDNVNFNTAINYASNTYHGATDLFRLGNGVGNAIFNPCPEDPVRDVMRDVGRASQITLIVAGTASGVLGGAPSVVEGELPGLPASAPRSLGLGSTGRAAPANLSEQLAMEEAMSNPGDGMLLPMGKGMTDSRWPGSQGWVKMAQNINGHEIHYVRNHITGATDDFKFIDRR
jgi:RHS repeat-associated protein